MEIPLLRTKTNIPQLPDNAIQRIHLTDRLENLAGKPLVIVTAPSGFGKTYLLSNWAGITANKVCWISLDSEDNEIHLFLRYLFEAVGQVCQVMDISLFNFLGSLSQKEISALLVHLLNDITKCGERLSIILDDYHLIESQDIHTALLFMIKNAPPTLQIVISSRTTPVWKMAQFRVADKVSYLQSEDLRFSIQETEEFLQKAVGGGISFDLAEVVRRKFEGWPAGLQLVALSLGSNRERNSPGIIKSIDAMVSDNLFREIFDQQTDAIRQFLKIISLVDSFNSSLCEAMTGKSDCQQLLDYLEKSNLFVIALDNEKYWYRFHHLFLNFLRQEEFTLDAESSKVYHVKAGYWFEQQGMIGLAIKHAAKSGDVNYLNEILRNNIVLMMHESQQGGLQQLLGLYLPKGDFYSVWAHIAYIWKNVYSGLLEVESELNEIESCNYKDNHIQGHVEGIKGYCAFMKGHYLSAKNHLERALDLLPQHDFSTYGICQIIFGSSIAMQGEINLGEKQVEDAIQLLNNSQDYVLAQIGTAEQVALLKYAGKLKKAASLAQESLKNSPAIDLFSDVPLVGEGFLYLRLSTIAYEWGNLEEAESLAKKAVEAGEFWNQNDLLSNSYGVLGLIYEAQRKFDLTVDNFRKAIDSAQNLPVQQDGMKAYLVLVYLRQGVQTQPDRWFAKKSHLINEEIVLGKITDFLCLVEILIHKKELQTALNLLERVHQEIGAKESSSYLMRILLLKAKAFFLSEDLDNAMDSIIHALEISMPESMIQSYLTWGGLQILPLLEISLNYPIFNQHVQNIIDAFPSADIGVPYDYALTKREKEILNLLCSSLSTQEIADRLTIAIHTLRTHTKNIYRKLGVNSRREAVDKAKNS